ncbi:MULTISPECIES: DUF2564 family protein [Bacillaceae]|uniref:DUF2564 family protein n=1 Tax=Evansella alkalicola TaxID=745819 RepID=A0ABS6JUP9_9BACI|nr:MULTISPECIES: DUF2564 family protein [Bacillaceae]MBU9721424.1 DUF2564 family protein [Bacillus alkalicola]
MSEPFDDKHQLEMSVKAAQKTVGAATMSMDPDQLEDATSAINDAKSMLQMGIDQHMDDEFISYCSGLIEKLEHQVHEAKH